PDQRIPEMAWPIERGDSAREPLANAEVPRAPRHVLPVPDEPTGHAGDRPLAGIPRRRHVQLHAALQIETHRRRRRDIRLDPNDWQPHLPVRADDIAFDGRYVRLRRSRRRFPAAGFSEAAQATRPSRWRRKSGCPSRFWLSRRTLHEPQSALDARLE